MSYWYPVFLSTKLKPNEVKSSKLLGEPLVFFRDEHNEVICLQDRCPHRSAPLSLGSVCNGRLACCYHGWEFGAKGECKKIPVLSAEDSIPKKAHASYKATTECYGLIWVWTGEPENADHNALPHAAFEYADNQAYYCYPFDTEVEIPHEYVIENLLDPAHLPFTHHGTLSKRSEAQPIEINSLEGIAGSINYSRGNKMQHIFRFIPPGLVQLDIIFSPTKMFRQCHFCIPLTPTRTRLITLQYSNYMKWLLDNAMIKALSRSFSNRVIRQDIEVLSGQYQNVKAGAKPYNQIVLSDKLVIKYRKWLEREFKQPWFQQFQEEKPNA